MWWGFFPLSSSGLILEQPSVSSDGRWPNIPDGHKGTVSSCQQWIASVQHCRVQQTQQHPSFLLSFRLSPAWKEVTPKPVGSDAPPAEQNYDPRQTHSAPLSHSPRTKSAGSKGGHGYSRLSHTRFSHTETSEKSVGYPRRSKDTVLVREISLGTCVYETLIKENWVVQSFQVQAFLWIQ